MIRYPKSEWIKLRKETIFFLSKLLFTPTDQDEIIYELIAVIKVNIMH